MRRKAQFMAKPIHAGTDGNSFLRKNYVKQASEAGALKVSHDGGSEPTAAGLPTEGEGFKACHLP